MKRKLRRGHVVLAALAAALAVPASGVGSSSSLWKAGQKTV